MTTDTTTDPWPIRFRACCPPYPGGRIVEVVPEHGWPGGIVWAPDPALLPPEHPCAPDEVRLAEGWVQTAAFLDDHEPVPGAPGKPRFRDGMWVWWVQPVRREE